MQEEKEGETELLVEKINAKYEYWDTVKYRQGREGIGAEELWRRVVAERMRSDMRIWDKYGIHFGLTNAMTRMCYEIDDT